MHYVMITIYMSRAIHCEHPEVHQVWVAYDGFFGANPNEAKVFLPFLRRTYQPLGLRISQEKLQVYGVNITGNKTTAGKTARTIKECEGRTTSTINLNGEGMNFRQHYGALQIETDAEGW